MSIGCVKCIRCETWVACDRVDPSRSYHVTCPNRECGVSYCLTCRRTPYHFRVPCDQVVTVERDWHDWVTTNQEQYLRQVANEGEEYQRLMKTYQAERETHEEVSALVSVSCTKYVIN